jgi:enediyne biosynthesis protein E4
VAEIRLTKRRFKIRPHWQRLRLLILCLLVSYLSHAALAEPLLFEDFTSASGLEFDHNSPISPERHIHLFMGSGLAWTDFDRDGVLDLLFCQGSANPVIQAGNTPAVNLWHGRSLEAGDYHNVSKQSGFRGTTYSYGVSVADYDNDGFADLFVTGFFSAVLYRNNGDGTFSDQTSIAKILPAGFGTGCCWTDLDRDGNLDLLYVRYIKLDPEKYPLCTTYYKGREIAMGCGPKRFAGDHDSVYLSTGDGEFQDVTVTFGFSNVRPRHGLGCVAVDLDDDGHAEVYVANDGMPNDLWKNIGGSQFEERGMLSGVAVNRFGAAEAGMGIAVGDVDGDLRPELFVTNYFDETNTLYRNEGDLLFLDVTEEFGIAGPSRKRLGFGANFQDFDNDGWLDLFVANGHVEDHKHLIGITDEPFAQLSQVFINRKGRRFEEISRRAGPFFQQPWVARGSAAADFDGDGKVDLAVLRLNDRAAILRNTSEGVGHWLTLELLGTRSNRDAIGATVIIRSSQSAWRRDRMSSASYLSCDSPRLHIGIGGKTKVDSVQVRWPSGESEYFVEIPIERITRLIEGTGRKN